MSFLDSVSIIAGVSVTAHRLFSVQDTSNHITAGSFLHIVVGPNAEAVSKVFRTEECKGNDTDNF